MPIAAVDRVFIFSAKPYQFLPASEYGKVTTQTTKEKLTLEEGGQHVVKDIVLQETFHHISVASDDDKEESEVKVEEHVEQSLTGRGSHVFSSEEKLITYSSGPNES
ncbi:hypothetical protein Acr_00g0057990 [Actinidia rufa]|uniref:Uncharacterized protein n=1 Tax=Actinidia rufa TaxID=165716 RepID=A0A7J0DMQ8_9ERIC|nr:hypothetical protein Acr_00g0057990 [Actinidia rufa]